MTTEKELTIQFLKEEAPEFYKTLMRSGKIESLSEEELTHLYASSLTEPLVDISDINKERLQRPNTQMIESALKKVKELENSNHSHSLNFFIVLRRVAMAASILLCIGLAINVFTSSPAKELIFIDKTSQETTDYAIRVRSGSSDEIFQDEFTTTIKELILQDAKNLNKSITLKLLPDNDSGSIVHIHLTVNGKHSSEQVKLTTKENVKEQLLSTIPRMLN